MYLDRDTAIDTDTDILRQTLLVPFGTTAGFVLSCQQFHPPLFLQYSHNYQDSEQGK